MCYQPTTMRETNEKRPRGRPRDYPDEGPMEVVTIRLPASLREKLTREADRRGISRNDVIIERLKK